MAVTVKNVIITALGTVPANVEVAYGKGFRVGGVTMGQVRFTDPGGPVAGRFSSTTPASVFSDSAGPVAPGVTTTFAMFSSAGGDVIADELTIENSSPSNGLYKLEFLNELGVVVATFTSITGSFTDKIIPVGTPVTPPFWTDHHGTREVV